MCNAITIAGARCQIKSTTKYCRIHADSNDIKVAELESELKNANAEIAKLRSDVNDMTHNRRVAQSKFKTIFDKLEADYNQSLAMLDMVTSERNHFKNGYSFLMQTNAARKLRSQEAVEENESLKATIAKLQDEIKLIRDQPTSPKSQARVTNVSYVVQQSPNAIKDLEKQVARLESELKASKKESDRLKAGHERDQFIRFYQAMHNEYEAKGVPFNERPKFYHDVRKSRNQVAHPIE